MANVAANPKILQDIEYKVLGNVICLLIALFGLLAGAMMTHFSLEYWREDLVPLALVAIMGFRLLRNFINAISFYQEQPPLPPRQAELRGHDAIQPAVAVAGQIPDVSSYSEDRVIEEVVKRIEAQKAEAAKKNKFAN